MRVLPALLVAAGALEAQAPPDVVRQIQVVKTTLNDITTSVKQKMDKAKALNTKTQKACEVDKSEAKAAIDQAKSDQEVAEPVVSQLQETISKTSADLTAVKKELDDNEEQAASAENVHKENHAEAEGEIKQLKVTSSRLGDAKKLIENNVALHGGGAQDMIRGVIKQMQSKAREDLEESESDLQSQQSAFLQQQRMSRLEASSLRDDFVLKNAELQDARSRLVNEEAFLERAKTSLKENTAFLAERTDECKQAAMDYAEIKGDREDEVKALEKAVEIIGKELSSMLQVIEKKRASVKRAESAAIEDFAASFLQVQSHQKFLGRLPLSLSFLQTGAQSLDTLSTSLATAVKGNVEALKPLIKAVETTLKATEARIAETTKEQKRCEDAVNQYKADLEDKEENVEALDNAVNNLKAGIAQLQTEQEADKKRAGEADEALKEQKKLHDEAVAAYEKFISDYQLTVKVIQKAAAVLHGFYDNAGKKGAEKGRSTGQFKTVVAMIHKIGDDMASEKAKQDRIKKAADDTYAEQMQRRQNMVDEQFQATTDDEITKAKQTVKQQDKQEDLESAKKAVEREKETLSTLKTEKCADAQGEFNAEFFEKSLKADNDQLGNLKNGLAVLRGYKGKEQYF